MTIKITKHHIGGELISILTRGMYPIPAILSGICSEWS